MPDYDPFNWYWIVASDGTRFWSSATSGYVLELPQGAGVTNIDSEENLTDVLAPYRLAGPLARKADLYAERDRRLALGFDHDFGDARGIHRIATTPADMVGWNEVTTWATAQAVTGNTEATLAIKTETGPTIVGAVEWFSVLNAATAFRQPLWAASFVLEAMDPIPHDFREDAYWQAQMTGTLQPEVNTYEPS